MDLTKMEGRIVRCRDGKRVRVGQVREDYDDATRVSLHLLYDGSEYLVVQADGRCGCSGDTPCIADVVSVDVPALALVHLPALTEILA